MELVNSQSGLIRGGVRCSGLTAADSQICDPERGHNMLEAFKEVNRKGVRRRFYFRDDVGI